MWYTITKKSQLTAGKPVRVQFRGRAIAVFLKEDGTVYAFDELCTHEDGPLAEGKVEGKVIECPWHGARFNMATGKALALPAREDIRVYKTKIESEEVMIETE